MGAVLGSSASAPSLNAAGREVAGRGAGSPQKPAEQKDGRTNPNFVNDRQRLLWQRRTEVPKNRYGKQLTAAHQIGWRPSLERFGVSEHGIKPTGELFPEL